LHPLLIESGFYHISTKAKISHTKGILIASKHPSPAPPVLRLVLSD
jgi:hypothetical protein